MRPPTVPQLAHVFACRFFVDVEVGCLEETRCAEEQCLAVGNAFMQQPQRQTLREKSERQFVFLVTERGRNLWKSVSSRPCASILLRIRLAFCLKRNCAAPSGTRWTRSSGKFFSGA